MNEKILIIDDEKDIGMLIQGLLEDEGYSAFIAVNSDQAYDIIEDNTPDLIIQDIWLQGSNDGGIDILKKVKQSLPNLPFIMISGHGTIETAISSIKLGAYDFIEKPFKSDRLLLMIQRALENSELKKQNIELKKHTMKQIKVMSKQIPENIRSILDKVAKSNSRILITGEAGTGKNITAQYIHEKSSRSNMPFMTFNCSCLDFEKLEIELFGVVNSASNEGAKSGLLELVNGGTLLLDEVINLPIETQGKILTLLQDLSYYKIGSNSKIHIDIRVIATTSSDNIEAKLSNGSFRKDLYYRLNVMPVHIPPLRNRKQDIVELIKGYMPNKFTDEAIGLFRLYNWPGNIKQLYNVLEWIVIINDNPDIIIGIEHLPSEISGVSNSLDGSDSVYAIFDNMMLMGLREARECFERHYLLSQVNKFDGNISKTSSFIGMERSALHRKLKSLGVFSNDKQNVA